MAPRTEKSVGDQNDAAAVPVEGGDQPIVASPEAAESGGPKLIRARHNDRFVFDADAHGKDAKDGIVTGDWRQFPAAQAKAVIEAAERNGVKLAVADPEKKG